MTDRLWQCAVLDGMQHALGSAVSGLEVGPGVEARQDQLNQLFWQGGSSRILTNPALPSYVDAKVPRASQIRRTSSRSSRIIPGALGAMPSNSSPTTDTG